MTICIHDREQNLFGDVVDGTIVTNEFGEYAIRCWHEIPEHFPHVKLDACIVMPNHVHGVLRLCASTVGVQNFEPLRNSRDFEPQPNLPDFEPLSNSPHFDPLQTRNIEPRPNSTPTQNQFQHIIPRSIGSIIRGFKIGVTKLVRQQMPNRVVWQRNYYENIIRDEKSLFSIRKYIRENPVNWVNDSKNHIEHEIIDLHLTKTGDTK